MPAVTVIRNGVIASACGLALSIAPAMAGATPDPSQTSKGASATQWTIQLHAPNAGTRKNVAQASGEGPNVALIGAEANGTTNWNWASETKNGTITTTHTSGKVSITLVGYSSFRGKPGKGKVHVTGVWACTP